MYERYSKRVLLYDLCIVVRDKNSKFYFCNFQYVNGWAEHITEPNAPIYVIKMF